MSPDVLKRFESKVVPEPNSGCWLWDGTVDSCGYARMHIGRKMAGMHREAYEHWNGHIPANDNGPRLCVCHTCDVRCCVNPAHLFLGTHAENIADMVAKGRQSKGEKKTPFTKLNPAKVSEIMRMLDAGITQRSAARAFGVSENTVSQIRLGGVWSHVTGVKRAARS